MCVLFLYAANVPFEFSDGGNEIQFETAWSIANKMLFLFVALMLFICLKMEHCK